MRASGILMHITSLPSPGGMGDLGKEAYSFADFLQSAGVKIWQVLPIGPTGYGESPYQSTSAFAGNPMMISLHTLRDQGLVSFDDSEIFVPADPEKADFDGARRNKTMLLRRAFALEDHRQFISGILHIQAHESGSRQHSSESC